MRTYILGFVAVMTLMVGAQAVSADSYQLATRQAIYEAQSRRYVADRTRYVTPRVNPASQRLSYVDRSTRYDGNVYSGYGSRTSARVIRSRGYATPATVTYVAVDNSNDAYNRVDDGEVDRVVVVQQNDDSRRYAGYARYKNGNRYGYTNRYRSYGYEVNHHPQVVYQPAYYRPVYVNYGYSYGHGYRHCNTYGYGVYRHGYGHRYGHHHGHRRHGSYGHFGYHRGGYHSHTGISFHFRF